MELNFDQIKAFSAVAKYGGFSLAAKKIFRTQSAVSIQIAKLESDIGQQLFDRTTKRIELTEAGTILLRYVEEIQRLVSDAEQELSDLERLEKGRLVISTSDTTACYRLPEIVRLYRHAYPGIEIVVRNSTSLKTIDAVMNYKVDIGVATLKNVRPELDVIPLFTRNDVLICHPDHSLARRKDVFLKDLERYQCILLDRNCSSRRILDEACDAAKVSLDITMELSSIEVIKQFVRINSGVSIVPLVAVEQERITGDLRTIVIRDFKKKQMPRMGIVYRKNKYLSLAAKSFLQLLQDNRSIIS